MPVCMEVKIFSLLSIQHHWCFIWCFLYVMHLAQCSLASPWSWCSHEDVANGVLLLKSVSMELG